MWKTVSMINKLLGRSAITNISFVNVFDSYTILFIKGDKSTNTSFRPLVLITSMKKLPFFLLTGFNPTEYLLKHDQTGEFNKKHGFTFPFLLNIYKYLYFIRLHIDGWKLMMPSK